MATTKTYKIGFFAPVYGDMDNKETLTEFFELAVSKGSGAAKSKPIGAHTYQLRNISITDNIVRGIFAKFRHDDIPLIGKPEEAKESEIELEPHEGLIEKNHIVYYTDKNLLLFQVVREASGIKMLEEYITEVTGHTTSCSPLLTQASLEQLVKGGAKGKQIELSFAAPTGAMLSTAGFSTITKRVLTLLSTSKGRSMNIKLGLGAHRKTGEILSMDIFDLMKEMLYDAPVDVRIARISAVDDQDDSQDIDLIADRILGYAKVEMIGRYPRTHAIFDEMRNIARAQKAAIKQVLEGNENY